MYMLTTEEKNRYIRLSYIGFALLMAILFEWFLWNKELGLGFFLFVLIYCIGFVALTFTTKQIHRRGALLLLIPILVLSLDVMIYNNELVHSLTLLVIFGLLVLFSILLPLKNPGKFSLSLLQIPVVRNIFIFFDQWGKVYRDLFRGKTKESKKNAVYRKIAIGIIISIPILFIFSSLFASADPTFNNAVDNFFGRFFDWVQIEEDTVGRVIRTILLTLFGASFLYIFLDEGHRILGSRVVKAWKIDEVVSGTILTLVNALFLFFLIVQLRTLQNAEFARSGFFQLTWVITLTALMLVVFYRSVSYHGAGKFLKTLMIVSIAQVGAIASFALYRMNLFQDLGYSALRLYVEWFIYFVLTILVLALVSIVMKKSFHFFFYTTAILGITAFTIVSSINVDKMVGEENYVRFISGESHIDYFRPLSVDAMEFLVAATQKTDQAEALKPLLEVQNRFIQKHESWQEWNLGVERARQFLPQ